MSGLTRGVNKDSPVAGIAFGMILAVISHGLFTNPKFAGEFGVSVPVWLAYVVATGYAINNRIGRHLKTLFTGSLLCVATLLITLIAHAQFDPKNFDMVTYRPPEGVSVSHLSLPLFWFVIGFLGVVSVAGIFVSALARPFIFENFFDTRGAKRFVKKVENLESVLSTLVRFFPILLFLISFAFLK